MYILYSVYDKKNRERKTAQQRERSLFNVIFKEEREKYFRELQGKKYVKLEIKQREKKK